MPASSLCCVRWSLAGSGSCPPGVRRPRLQAQLPLQHHRAALPWLLPSVTYELVHLLTSFPFAVRIKANLSEHTSSFLILHLRVQRSQSSVWHSGALQETPSPYPCTSASNSVCFESSPLAALSECDSFWPVRLGCRSQGLPESLLCVPEPASPPPGPESQNLHTQQSAGGSAPSSGREAGLRAQ